VVAHYLAGGLTGACAGVGVSFAFFGFGATAPVSVRQRSIRRLVRTHKSKKKKLEWVRHSADLRCRCFFSHGASAAWRRAASLRAAQAATLPRLSLSAGAERSVNKRTAGRYRGLTRECYGAKREHLFGCRHLRWFFLRRFRNSCSY
jgi:alpha-beta hydrolase superfamily lysophospholipase